MLCRIGDVEPLTDVNEVSGDVIPAAEIGDVNVEATSDAAEVVSPAHGVDGGVGSAGVADSSARVV